MVVSLRFSFSDVDSRILPTNYSRALALIMFKRGVLHVNDSSLDFSVIDAFLTPVLCVHCFTLVLSRLSSFSFCAIILCFIFGGRYWRNKLLNLYGAA